MSESMALVGLDIHQAQTVAAVLDPVSGELRVHRLRGEPDRVVPVFLEDLDCPVRAVYEAAPSGFALARVAEERGLDVRVVAPGSIPGASGGARGEGAAQRLRALRAGTPRPGGAVQGSGDALGAAPLPASRRAKPPIR